jgi:hypothetical protein
MSTITLDSDTLDSLIRTLDQLREALAAAAGGTAPPPPHRRSDDYRDPPALSEERDDPGRQEFLRRMENQWRRPTSGTSRE